MKGAHNGDPRVVVVLLGQLQSSFKSPSRIDLHQHCDADLLRLLTQLLGGNVERTAVYLGADNWRSSVRANGMQNSNRVLAARQAQYDGRARFCSLFAGHLQNRRHGIRHMCSIQEDRNSSKAWMKEPFHSTRETRQSAMRSGFIQGNRCARQRCHSFQPCLRQREIFRKRVSATTNVSNLTAHCRTMLLQLRCDFVVRRIDPRHQRDISTDNSDFFSGYISPGRSNNFRMFQKYIGKDWYR
mmetsp:Transcript_208/g.374  ORF Transcript_208/g.374 Transcript_208/m.374 type:complete len:242 (-) Transcript_208:612-1337(-)